MAVKASKVQGLLVQYLTASGIFHSKVMVMGVVVPEFLVILFGEISDLVFL